MTPPGNAAEDQRTGAQNEEPSGRSPAHDGRRARPATPVSGAAEAPPAPSQQGDGQESGTARPEDPATEVP